MAIPSALLVVVLEASLCLAQSPAVTTRAFDNDRTGANLQETVLTPAVIKTRGVRRITTIPVIGDARGTEAQPLILPGVSVNGAVHNVMVLPSMANVVRGVEARDGTGLWQVTLCQPVQGSRQIDMHTINDKWGVLSTGVIDAESRRVYLVAWCSPDGSARPQTAVHRMYTLNLADGSLAFPAVSLGGATSGSQAFSSTMRKQRSSLLLTTVRGKKTVFFASGTVFETTNGAAGWVFAFDCASNQLAAAVALSQGRGAGIWMAGQGLAADAQGFLYGITGNGSFNGVQDFGESVVKLKYQPAAGGGKASLKVVSWWSPYSDAGRVGQNPVRSEPRGAMPRTKLAGSSEVSEAARMQMPVGGAMERTLEGARKVQSGPTTETGGVATLVFPRPDATMKASWNDEDLGSGGGTLIERFGVYLASGKDGIAYPVRSGNMGDTKPADFLDVKANCAKLAAPPVWIAASPGPVDACPQDETALDFLPWGKTRHMHMTPVQYTSPTRGLQLFAWGENSQLHDWSMSSAGTMTYVAQGDEIASGDVAGSPGGMPGGFCSLSANGTKDALLWCTIPRGDANAEITEGRLLCYDAEDLQTNANGTKKLRLLWDSQTFGLGFKFNKFLPPIVWDGQVYVANYNGGVDVYAP